MCFKQCDAGGQCCFGSLQMSNAWGMWVCFCIMGRPCEDSQFVTTDIVLPKRKLSKTLLTWGIRVSKLANSK